MGSLSFVDLGLQIRPLKHALGFFQWLILGSPAEIRRHLGAA